MSVLACRCLSVVVDQVDDVPHVYYTRYTFEKISYIGLVCACAWIWSFTLTIE